jgi:hypothetical protein
MLKVDWGACGGRHEMGTSRAELSDTGELARLRVESIDCATAPRLRRGRRLTVELVLRLSLLLDADNLLEKLATRFVVFDPAFLRDSVGHEFPPAPVGLISQSGER